MKKWLSKNLELFIFLLGLIAIIIVTQRLTLKNAELEAQLIEQQKHYELTIEIPRYM